MASEAPPRIVASLSRAHANRSRLAWPWTLPRNCGANAIGRGMAQILLNAQLVCRFGQLERSARVLVRGGMAMKLTGLID